MRVCLYAELEALSAQSGIGSAIRNHKRALELVGVEWTSSLKDNFDILHICSVGLKSILIAQRFRKKGKKIVIHAHTTADDFRNSFIFSNEVYPLLQRYLRFYYSLGDVVLCPSEYTKGVLESYGIRRPIRVVSNGVDTERFCYSPRRRKKFRREHGLEGVVPLAVGHVFVRKGIETFTNVARKFPNLTFLWIGKRYPKTEDRRTSRIVKNAPSNVRFVTRWVENIVDAYCGCDIFFFPSYCENQGIVVLEAAACERPLLLRDIPVYRVLKHGKECLRARTDDEFVTHLQELVENPKLRRRLARRARRFALQHSLKRVGMRLKQIYEELFRK